MDSLSFSSFVRDDLGLCIHCYRKMRPRFLRWRVGPYRALALYEYENVKDVLYQFKGCGDIELSSIFFAYAAPLLKRYYHGFVVVPVPSSASHDLERGFNQVVEMCKCLNLPILDVLEKTAESKQSDLSAKQRKNVTKILAIKKPGQLKGKKVLLVDDVFTTGSTIAGCLKLLEKEGPKTIRVLVMAKTLPRGPNPI